MIYSPAERLSALFEGISRQQTMLRARVVSFARAVRAFATAKEKKSEKDVPFLSDAIAKAVIGKDPDVAASFVSAFAPLVHKKGVQVADVSPIPETTGLSLVRDMKHDIAFRYSVGGAETEVLEVVPQHFSRALVEIQLRSEHYLPGRSLAHASGHYLAAVEEEAKVVRAERLKAKEQQAAKRPKSLPRESRNAYDSAVYTAYVRVEPVHLLMLSDFCYAHDTQAKMWRAPKSSSVLAEGGKYGWASPLFSTFRLTTDAESVQLRAGVDSPGLNSFASSLRERLSITIVHLPLVPSVLDDEAAWAKVATLPQHHEALKKSELREWLYYLARTSMKGGKVEMPPELRTHSIFRKSAAMAEDLLRSPGGFPYSEKEMADLGLQNEREKEEALEMAREAAAAELKKERAAAAAELKKERAAATNERAAAAERERAAAAELEKDRAAAAERERAAAAELEKERAAAATLRAELGRLKGSGSGTP